MAKLPPQHHDLFNQLLSVGDYVAYPGGSRVLGVGHIVKITPKMIRINPAGHVRNEWGFGEYQKHPAECIKLEGAALTMYILSKSG